MAEDQRVTGCHYVTVEGAAAAVEGATEGMAERPAEEPVAAGCHVSVRGAEAEAGPIKVIGAAINPSKRKSGWAGKVVGNMDNDVAAI
jgi:hypothetical protein